MDKEDEHSEDEEKLESEDAASKPDDASQDEANDSGDVDDDIYDESDAYDEDDVYSDNDYYDDLEEEEEPHALMDFWDHVEELRTALLRSILGIFLGILLVGVFFMKIFHWLKLPLDKALADEPGTLSALTTTNVMGSIGVLFQVCMVGGVAIGMPFIIWNIAKFVGPGLTQRERGVVAPACIATVVLFGIGALFAFFVIVPAALEFTIWLNRLLGLETIWRAQSYYSFVAWTIIAIGLTFEFPLVIVILEYLGLVTPAQLREGRRYAIVIIVVVAAFITPGQDPFSFVFISIPMIIFYEISILIGDRVTSRANLDDYDLEE